MTLESTARRFWPIALLAAAVACGGGDDDGEGPGEADGGAGEAAVVEVTTYAGDEQGPALFAGVQDGEGAWEVVESGDGVYSFEVRSGRFGFAYACPTTNFLHFYYSTVDEGTREVRGCEGPWAEGSTLRVTVNGLGEGETGWIGVGQGAQRFESTAPTSTFTNRPAGLHDVIATIKTGNSPGVAERIFVERDVEVLEGEDVDLTIDMTDAVDATTQTITLVGFNHLSEALVYLETSNGSHGIVGSDGITGAYGGFPEAETTDMYRIHVEANRERGFPATHHFAREPQDLTLTAPEPVVIADASVAAATPHLRAQASFALKDGATYTLEFRQGVPAHAVRTYFSAGWLDGQATSFTWQQPDLSGLAGWDGVWALVDEVEVWLTVTELSGDADPDLVLPRYPQSRPVPFSPDLDGKHINVAGGTAIFVP